MPQDMMEDECSRDIAGSKDALADPPRALTYDQKKAAEAAFRGEPFNPAWSGAAARVYAGIVSVMTRRDSPTSEESDIEADCFPVF